MSYAGEEKVNWKSAYLVLLVHLDAILNLSFSLCKMSFTALSLSSSLLDAYNCQVRYYMKVLLFLSAK